jgi:hypothetical protein
MEIDVRKTLKDTAHLTEQASRESTVSTIRASSGAVAD